MPASQAGRRRFESGRPLWSKTFNHNAEGRPDGRPSCLPFDESGIVGEPKSVADPMWTREQLLKIPTVTPELLDAIEADPSRAVRRTIIETVEDFVRIASQTTSTLGLNAWWRGQIDSAWRLQPAIARKKRARGFEVNRTMLFRSRARTRYSSCPGKDDLSDWLFLMQHFGLHTRLLDWTLNPLVALYFAVEGESKADAAVFSLAPQTLNAAHGHGAMVLLPNHGAVQALVGGAFNDREPTDETLAILPEEIDTRMLVQRSTFTIHGGTSALEDHPYAATFMTKLIVPGAKRVAVRKQLRGLGVDRPSLFPDLSNLATDLND
jgi:hypothetical protein